MAEIRLDGVTKVFADGTKAVDAVDLDVPDAGLMVLVGPSGCGKTTILRMVAGLEDITAGSIRIGDRVVNDIPPGQRDLAMVFQNYALYPHMTVYENIALSLKIRKLKRVEVERRVRHAAHILHLDDIMRKRPRELSGGQRQRVAMGRAIVRHPQAFLMDEPLSNLDAKLRVQMRAEILSIQKELRVTTIYVTHDQTEAMTLGDLVAVMRNGTLQQVATTQEIYAHPANLFVGGFIGSPAMNLVHATLVRRDGGTFVEFASHRLVVPPDVLASRPALVGYEGRGLILGIRPENMEDEAIARGELEGSKIPIVVRIKEAMGSDVYLHFTVDAPPVLTEDTKELAAELGAEVLEELEEGALRSRSSFIARVSPETRATIGEPMEIRVDTSKLYFFDAETGQTIDNGLVSASPYRVATAAAT